MLRSGKEVGADHRPSKSSENEDEKLQFEEESQDKATTRIEQSMPQPLHPLHILIYPNQVRWVQFRLILTIFHPIYLFPRRFMQSKKEEAEKDILETFRKVQVNIPLLDAIKQVSRYAKFFKELCTTRKMISTKEVVKVGENVSAIL